MDLEATVHVQYDSLLLISNYTLDLKGCYRTPWWELESIVPRIRNSVIKLGNILFDVTFYSKYLLFDSKALAAHCY